MYGFTTTLTGVSFEAALAKTIEALKAEGFGIPVRDEAWLLAQGGG